MFSFVFSEPCLRIFALVACSFSMVGPASARVTVVRDERVIIREMDIKARQLAQRETEKKAEKERRKAAAREERVRSGNARAAMKQIRAARKAERASERKGTRAQRRQTAVRVASRPNRVTVVESFELEARAPRKPSGLASLMEEEEEEEDYGKRVSDSKASPPYLADSIAMSCEAFVVEQEAELQPLIFTEPVKADPKPAQLLRKAMLRDMKKHCGKQTKKLVQKMQWQPVQ
ncbi:hypothetical protein HDZ31DRAFT_62814 [Schizophyllum fasciatum]